jgi:hypothetical protein
MTERPQIFLVARREELVAELVVARLDPPWFRGRAVPRDGFAALRPLFDDVRDLVANLERDPAAWASAYRRLRGEVRLIKPDGNEVPEFLLHIDGNRAWWRCGDRRPDRWLEQQPRPRAASATRRPPASVTRAPRGVAAPHAAAARPLHARRAPLVLAETAPRSDR